MRLSVVARSIVMALLAGRAVMAGPPLLSDDPHTLGSGRVELIATANAFGVGDATDIFVPMLDLTLGVFEGVDLTLVASPSFAVIPREPVDTAAAVEAGLKWQPVRGEHWNVAFSPFAALNAGLLRESNVVLPVQIEYRRPSFAIGIDGGYIVDLDRDDLWFLTLYGGWSVVDSLELLGEVWGGRNTPNESSSCGINLGLDWQLAPSLHLLAAGGPGMAIRAGRRARWYAYLGLQWNWALWTPSRSAGTD